METYDVYRTLTTIASDVVMNFVTEVLTELNQIATVVGVVNVGRSCSLGLGNESEVFETAWKLCRTLPDGTRLLIEMSSDFHFRALLQGFDMTDVISAMSTAYALRELPSRGSNNPPLFMDDIVSTRTYTKEKLQTILTANFWMLFLQLVGKDANLANALRTLQAKANSLAEPQTLSIGEINIGGNA